MLQEENKNLTKCIDYLNKVEIPVLKQTSRNLAELCENENNISTLSVAEIVKQDPFMTVKLMRYLQQYNQRAQKHEILDVKQVLMMLGLETSLNKVSSSPLVEDVLGRKKMSALVNLLRVTHRAHRASEYAYDWAVRLNDLHYEEVRMAALLHDIAEILMWCFAPTAMLKVKDLQQQDKTLRSNTAQEKVLGFTLQQLQLALSLKWHLPKLLVTLVDDGNADQKRVRNVVLAVNIARHSANGWDDAALPDDYAAVGDLLGLQVEDVQFIVNAELSQNSQEKAS